MVAAWRIGGLGSAERTHYLLAHMGKEVRGVVSMAAANGAHGRTAERGPVRVRSRTWSLG